MRPDPETCRDPDLLAAEVRRLRAVIAASEHTDVATRLHQTRANMIGTADEQHYWDCHDAAAEIERLRRAICCLAEQDATVSVCEGRVTVTMDATLTVEEREAIEVAAAAYAADFGEQFAAVLRHLLERLN